jgi:transcriptional regulator with XRE-family HTH domain
MHLHDLIQVIKNRREMLQVTQETLAEYTGVGLRTIKQFESGRGNPTLLTIYKITEVLGLDMALNVKNLNK